MKLRARRVTIAAAVLGAAVVAVLVVADRDTIRDHIDAWRFQSERKTEMIRGVPDGPRPTFVRLFGGLFERLASCSGTPVIVDSQDDHYRRMVPWGVSNDLLVWQIMREPPCSLVAAGGRRDLILKVLGSNGWRVIEQRFPRRAYVVIRDQGAR